MHGHQQEAIAHLATAQEIEPDPKRGKQLEQLRADSASGYH
jgi:hypothetical protein